MPRTARKKSSNRIYHVMLRGINRQQIFYDKGDYQYFTKLLERYKEPCATRKYRNSNYMHIV